MWQYSSRDALLGDAHSKVAEDERSAGVLSELRDEFLFYYSVSKRARPDHLAGDIHKHTNGRGKVFGGSGVCSYKYRIRIQEPLKAS